MISPIVEKSYLDTFDVNFFFTVKSEDIKIFTLAAMFALIKCQTSWKVLVNNRNFFGSFSEIFGVVQNILENNRKRSYNFRTLLG